MSPDETIAKESEHQRRVRYKGTHPKTFKEKYKELQPEKYAEDVAKVMEKGRTPAGMHRPICVDEILEILRIQPGQTGLDATLGYGGHTLEILKCLGPTGRLYAFDVDPLELPRTKERLARLGFGPELLDIRLMNFSEADRILPDSGQLHFALADLGISSMQIDNPERGFSFKLEGPLDLRLNPEAGESAADLLKRLSPEELRGLLLENADEPYYEEIADAIISALRKGTELATTTAFQKIIKEALKTVPGIKDEEIKKACQRCFQALRIEVNHEFEALDAFLEKLPKLLVSGGRAAILSFHSGEDRRVKKSFKRFFRDGVYCEIAPDPIRASPDECRANSRARSAKLRWAIKT